MVGLGKYAPGFEQSLIVFCFDNFPLWTRLYSTNNVVGAFHDRNPRQDVSVAVPAAYFPRLMLHELSHAGAIMKSTARLRKSLYTILVTILRLIVTSNNRRSLF